MKKKSPVSIAEFKAEKELTAFYQKHFISMNKLFKELEGFNFPKSSKQLFDRLSNEMIHEQREIQKHLKKNRNE